MTRIIYYEGTDCAGKGIAIEETKQFLISMGYTVKVIIEPGCTLSMEDTRKTLLKKEYSGVDKLNYLSRRFLYAADHAQSFSVIASYYGNVDYILIDRHTVVSDTVYGPMMVDENERELALQISKNIKECYDKYLEMMNQSFREDSELIFLSVTDETLFDRYTKRNAERGNETDISDEQSFDIKYKINSNYNYVAKAYKIYDEEKNISNNMFKKIHVIDGNMKKEEVLSNILEKLNIQ